MPIKKLLQFWRRQPPAPPPPVAQVQLPLPSVISDSDKPRLDRLELQEAWIQHLEWCVQFNDHLIQVRPGEPDLVRTLPDADHSAVGLWLKDARTRAPGQHPRFADLVAAHQRFHDLAEEVLRLAGENRMDLASTLLNTDFERARLKVLEILREMQKD